MPEQEVETGGETPQYFPMSLAEYAVNVSLDPMLHAALSVWVSPEDRLQTDWDAILAAYRVKPTQ